mmetsp:Transcript_105490/g.128771  ORF Transcript_105490/g.128771 Transcript_105490/m.128771 type:complete len:105 (-) Transcript_105490:109-423(-)
MANGVHFDGSSESNDIINLLDTTSDSEPQINESIKDFKKLYQVARKLSRDFGVNISIPEYVFCGCQTSDKTSVAQSDVGIMTNAPNKKITNGIQGQGIKKSCIK